MNQFEFLQKIDGLKDVLPEDRVIELYTDAEEIFESHNEELESLNNEIDDLKDERSDLESEVFELNKQVDQLESEPKFILDGHHNNIVTQSLFEKLFSKIDRIPMSELENLVNKYE